MEEDCTTETVFDGFSPPSENWSKLPHAMILALPLISTLGEAKCILYVLRHTWGYQEYEEWQAKHITLDEFLHGRKRRDGTRLDNGVGMSKPSVLKGLRRAIRNGFLIRFVDNSDRGREMHYYRLRRHKEEPGDLFAVDPEEPEASTTWAKLAPETRDIAYARSNGRCAFCDRRSVKWHYTHIVPPEKGGTDDPANIALSCPVCNLSKGERTPEEWDRPVFCYEEGVKKVYRGWSSFLTTPGKDPLPRTEKDTQDEIPESENDSADALSAALDEVFPREEPESPNLAQLAAAAGLTAARQPDGVAIATAAHGVPLGDPAWVKPAWAQAWEVTIQARSFAPGGVTLEQVLRFVERFADGLHADLTVPTDKPTIRTWYAGARACIRAWQTALEAENNGRGPPRPDEVLRHVLWGLDLFWYLRDRKVEYYQHYVVSPHSLIKGQRLLEQALRWMRKRFGLPSDQLPHSHHLETYVKEQCRGASRSGSQQHVIPDQGAIDAERKALQHRLGVGSGEPSSE